MRKLDPEAVISTVVFGEDSMSRSWMLMVWALLRENGEIELDSPLARDAGLPVGGGH